MSDSRARVGFVFSTKDRTELSERSLASVDLEGGFDLIWVDGSKTPEGKALPYSVKLNNAILAEVHSGVTGGPDAAIRYGLNRLLELGYDYCGLIENDIEFKPGWFRSLMNLFHLGELDGIKVGGATARSIGSRVLLNRPNYSFTWNAGAGMLLLTKEAARLILLDYGNHRASEMAAFYRDKFGIDISGTWEMYMGLEDRVHGCDWWFAPQLYEHGLACLSTVPSLASNMDIDLEAWLRTRYVGNDMRISIEDDRRFASVKSVLDRDVPAHLMLSRLRSEGLNASENGYQPLLDAAESALQSGDIRSAKKNLQLILAYFPNDLAALNDLAVAKMLAKDWMDAARVLGKVLEREPDNPTAVSNLQILKNTLNDNLKSLAPTRRCWCGGNLQDSSNADYYQCRNCGTMVSKTQRAEDDLKRLHSLDGYRRDYASKLSFPMMEQSEGIVVRKNAARLKAISQYKQNIRTLLEIGSAEGAFLLYCRTNGIENVVGIEADEAARDFAREHSGLEYVIAGLFPNVSLPFAKYDVVAGFDVLGHFTDPVRALIAVRDLLADDGLCIFEISSGRKKSADQPDLNPLDAVYLFDYDGIDLLFDRAGLYVVDKLQGSSDEETVLIARKKVSVEYNPGTTRPRQDRAYKKKTIGVGLIEHMGDIVACEPVARYLRATNPDSHIVWCVRQVYCELIDTNPFVDETLVVTCLTEWMLLVDNGVFDKVVDLHVDKRVCPTCNIELHKKNIKTELTFGNYYKQGNLLSAFSRGAGLPALEGEPLVYIPDSVVERINALNLPERFIVVHCKSNETVRDWNESHWASLAGEVASRWGLPIVEVGSAPLLNGKSPNAMNYCGKLSILETAEVIRRAALFVGIDSGPAHLANAVGTFGIILLGDYANFQHYLPYSGRYSDGTNAELIYSDVGSASNIPVARVIEAIERNIERGTVQSRQRSSEAPTRPASAAGAPSAKLIAFYLPQFHPIPENDKWWGKGFTEWRNVVTAKPLLPGHYQPHLPADLGFYDLRLSEVREAQAELAKEHGIAGFCYWHYWFNGRLLLERPFNEVLESGNPDFPFCLAWANENWTRNWNGQRDDVLQQQIYGGAEDAANHFNWLLKAFRDPRYIRINGKPVFLFYRPEDIPRIEEMISLWRRLAADSRLPGLFLIAMRTNVMNSGKREEGNYDGELVFQPQFNSLILSMSGSSRLADDGRSHVYDYDQAVDVMQNVSRSILSENKNTFACVVPSWDNTSRRKELPAFILGNSTPASYENWLRSEIGRVADRDPDQRIVFINAWNEWAEGNHLEPDLKFGREFLEATKRALLGTTGGSSVVSGPEQKSGPLRENVDLTLLMVNARQAYADGNIEEAEKGFVKALSETARLIAYYFHISKVAAHQGNRESTEEMSRRLKVISSLNSQIHNDFGIICFNKGDLDKAVVHLKQAVSSDETNSTAKKNLAAILMQRGETEEATELYQQLASVNEIDQQTPVVVGEKCHVETAG